MQKAKTFLIFFLGLVVGLVVGVLTITTYYNKTTPTFWQFKLFDLISFISYVVIGVYVAHHLKNRFSDRQMKKNMFVSIANDIEKLFEQELPCLHSFMKSNSDKKDEKIKVLTVLRKINNKIHILEDHKEVFTSISKHVMKVRDDYNIIKEIITGDEFDSPKLFTQTQINDMYKFTDKVILSLDEIKLNIFV
jgi:DMSO reductase anchor subunit